MLLLRMNFLMVCVPLLNPEIPPTVWVQAATLPLQPHSILNMWQNAGGCHHHHHHHSVRWNCYLITDSDYIEFVSFNLKVLHSLILVIADLLKIFHTSFVSIFIIYLHTQFHVLSSSGSLIITIKLTSVSRIFLEKLTVINVVRKFHNFNGTWRHIIILTGAHYHYQMKAK
jgi:hypothetical protein